jgi:mannose-6-phosphate isomerase-like protein (cupin superfamily)
MRCRRACVYFFSLSILAVISQSACQRSTSKATGLLPAPKPEEIRASDYQPQNPFVQSSPGLMTRTVFAVEPGKGAPYHVDVMDLLISPGQQAVDVPHAGAAVFEVRDGGGMATVAEKSQEVNEGSTFSVGDGEPLKFASKGQGPVTLRAYVVKIP